MLCRWRKATPFTPRLTFAEFLEEIGGKVPKRCPVLGIKMSVGNRPFAGNSASVDRVNNAKPYRKGNIAIISYRANALKNDGSAEEHRRIAAWMERMARRRAKHGNGNDNRFRYRQVSLSPAHNPLKT
jgi:hypothetical protein